MAAALFAVLLGSASAEPPNPASQAADDRSLAQWIEQLEHGQREARHRAANALGSLGPAAAPAVPALRAALTDANHEVRWCAIDALGRLGVAAKPAVPNLAARLVDLDDKYSRRLAARALGQLGPAASDGKVVLLGVLGGEDRQQAVEAALAVWRIAADPCAVSALTELVADSDDEVAFAACVALSKVGPDGHVGADGIKSLIADLARQDQDVRRAAAQWLGSLGLPALEPLVAKLNSAKPDSSAAVVTALGFVHRQLCTAVLERVGISAEELAQGINAVQRVSIPALAGALRGKDQLADRRVAAALADAGIVALPVLAENMAAGGAIALAAGDALGDLLDDLPDDQQLVSRFARQLAKAEPLLSKSLAGQLQVRRAAARALAVLPVPLSAEGVARLRGAVTTDDLPTRHFAARALLRSDARESAEP